MQQPKTPLEKALALVALEGATEVEKQSCFRLFRLMIYFLILIGLAFGMWGLAHFYKTQIFEEYGPVENLQIFVLLGATGVFLYTAFKNKFYRPLTFLFAGFTAFAFIRELDAFFDKMVPVITWKFAFVFPLLGMVYLFKNRKNLRLLIFDFLNSNAFYLMLTAMIIFIPLAQCVGHKKLIIDALGSVEQAMYVRRLVEESMELMAYVLILLAAIDLHWTAPKTIPYRKEK